MTIHIPPVHSPDFRFEELWVSCASTGSRIGRGTTRDVYAIPDHPYKVLKVCTTPSNQTNWIEMVIYHAARANKRFYAEVHSVSWSGKFLVMERLERVTAAELSAVRQSFPPFVNDNKPENFGKDPQGNIKMLDYGMLELGPDEDAPPPSTFF